jgi:hypothetical protein
MEVCRYGRRKAMTLTVKQLRSVANMLSDPGSAANAAGILAREAKERGVLVADLIAQMAAPAPQAPSSSPASAPPSAPPTWQDVDDEDDDGPYVKLIDADHVGLVSMLLAETDKAWLVEKPDGSEAGWRSRSSSTMAKTRKGE